MKPNTLLLALVLASTVVACRPRVESPEPDAPKTSVWSVDFIRTKPGQFDRYLRYVDANWARARRTVLAQGGIGSFRVLVSTPSEEAPWDVVLMTEYADSAAYARAEDVFLPVLRAQGETLIDGLSGRGPDNPLKQTVASSVLTATVIGGGP